MYKQCLKEIVYKSRICDVGPGQYTTDRRTLVDKRIADNISFSKAERKVDVRKWSSNYIF